MNAPAAVLVVAPHHDDEVIGCGGTIAGWAQAGCQIDVVDLTAGYSGLPDVSDVDEATAMREAEAIQAARILGVQQTFFWRYPDRDLQYSPAIVQRLTRLLRQGNYRGLLFPHGAEGDYEHQVAHQIAGEAAWQATGPYFPALGAPVKLERLLLYEVWTPIQHVNWKQDISVVLEQKVAALTAYRSQFTPQQAEQIVGLNRYRGAMSGHPVVAMEAFQYHVR